MTADDEVTAAALAAKAGDARAAETFVRLTQRDLLRFLSLLAAPQEVEDLAQETYLRATRAAFDGRSSGRTWLFAIARNVAADHVRRAQRRPRTSELVADVPAPTHLDEAVALRRLLAGLDDDRREAFVLTQVVGLSYAEAATVCGCPVGTIRSRVFRARSELVAALEPPRDSAAS